MCCLVEQSRNLSALLSHTEENCCGLRFLPHLLLFPLCGHYYPSARWQMWVCVTIIFCICRPDWPRAGMWSPVLVQVGRSTVCLTVQWSSLPPSRWVWCYCPLQCILHYNGEAESFTLLVSYGVWDIFRTSLLIRVNFFFWLMGEILVFFNCCAQHWQKKVLISNQLVFKTCQAAILARQKCEMICTNTGYLY